MPDRRNRYQVNAAPPDFSEVDLQSRSGRASPSALQRISSRDDTYSFYFGNMVSERVLNSEFHTADTEIRKTFYDCTTLADTVMYLRGPFVDAVYGEQQSYRDGRRLPESEWGVVLEQSKLLGAVRLRQQRVVPGARCLS